MSGWVLFCLGMYLGGVAVGMILCLAVLDNYVLWARRMLVICVVFWPIALLAAVCCAAAFAIGRMVTGRNVV